MCSLSEVCPWRLLIICVIKHICNHSDFFQFNLSLIGSTVNVDFTFLREIYGTGTSTYLFIYLFVKNVDPDSTEFRSGSRGLMIKNSPQLTIFFY